MTTAPRLSLDEYLRRLDGRCSGCGHHLTLQRCVCDSPAETDEWSIFKAAVLAAVRDDGTVHLCDVRPAVRGRIQPKHIGLLWRRAKSRAENFLVDTGEREESDDVVGGNADKLDRIYRLASVRAA